MVGLNQVYYRPERSCEGYVFTSVCLSMGGVSLSASWDTPPPGAGTPPGSRDPRQQTTTAADGTHPTGMRSCSVMYRDIASLLSYSKLNLYSDSCEVM